MNPHLSWTDSICTSPLVHTSVGYVESKLLQSDLASVISKVEEASRRPSVSGEGGGARWRRRPGGPQCQVRGQMG